MTKKTETDHGVASTTRMDKLKERERRVRRDVVKAAAENLATLPADHPAIPESLRHIEALVADVRAKIQEKRS